MFCCLDSPFSDSKEAYSRQAYDNGSSFPGNRRFEKTGGNALAAAPQSRQTGDSNSMVAVTVPEGISGGQQIQVAAPDGRMILATVPENMGPGSQFMVHIPPAVQAIQTEAPSTSVVVEPHKPVDYGGLVPVSPPQSSPSVILPEPFVPAVPVHATPGATAIQPAYAVSSPSPIHATPVVPVPPPPVTQSMMKVQVPPGATPGSTIHVQVPNENRVLAVQVPQGVSEFHVAYEPSRQTTTSPVIAPSVVPIPPPTNERRLLVRVPPGTAPGTALHVTVPDEPGRVIAAKVPPGNVSEFYVSYQPASRNMMNGGASVPQTSARNNIARNPNDNNNNSGMGSVFLPLLGGAALGAAGMSMYDHGRVNDAYDNGDYYGDTAAEADQGGYGQQAGDYGNYADDDGAADAFGDDGGGGFDFGGGDF